MAIAHITIYIYDTHRVACHNCSVQRALRPGAHPTHHVVMPGAVTAW